MSSLQLPPRLMPGGTIGVVAPASPLYNRGDIGRAAAVLEGIGYRVKVGDHAGCVPREYKPAFPSTLSLEDVLDELIRPLGIPTIYNLPLGHGTHLATLPLGIPARLDADAKRFEIVGTATVQPK